MNYPDELLSINDVMRETGLSRRKVDALIRDGRLPVVDIGTSETTFRSVRVRRLDLSEFVTGKPLTKSE